MNLRLVFTMVLLVLVAILPESTCARKRRLRTTTRTPKLTTTTEDTTPFGYEHCKRYVAGDCPVWEGQCTIDGNLCKPRLEKPDLTPFDRWLPY